MLKDLVKALSVREALVLTTFSIASVLAADATPYGPNAQQILQARHCNEIGE